MAEMIHLHKTIAAPPERVYQAFTRSEDLIRWFSAGGGWTTPYAESEARPGGRLKIGFEDPAGTNSFDFLASYTRLEEPGLVEYVLDDQRRVSVELKAAGDGTEVSWRFDAEGAHSREQQQEGWQNMLDNLARYLEETGQ